MKENGNENMNWKIWTWPGQIRTLEMELRIERESREVHSGAASPRTWEQLTIARRALARTKESGLTDDQMAEAFTHLLENKGFEAILQLLTSEELEAVDSMVGAKTSFEEMKHHAGAVAALSQFHARLIELEQQAKEMAKKAA